MNFTKVFEFAYNNKDIQFSSLDDATIYILDSFELLGYEIEGIYEHRIRVGLNDSFFKKTPGYVMVQTSEDSEFAKNVFVMFNEFAKESLDMYICPYNKNVKNDFMSCSYSEFMGLSSSGKVRTVNAVFYIIKHVDCSSFVNTGDIVKVLLSLGYEKDSQDVYMNTYKLLLSNNKFIECSIDKYGATKLVTPYSSMKIYIPLTDIGVQVIKGATRHGLRLSKLDYTLG